MPDTTPYKRKWVWILIVIIAIILRAPAFFNPIIDEDEAYYAAAARVMNSGGLLYKDAVDLKPPLIFYFYSLCFSVFGNDLRVLHGVTVFWVLATALAIAYITHQFAGQTEAARLSALLYVLFTPTFVPQALSTNGEILMNLPLALSVLSFLKSEQSKSNWLMFLSGLFCGIAFLIKYQSGVLLWGLLAYLLLVKPFLFKAWPGKKELMQSSLVIGGFAGVLIALYGIFRYLGNWEDFYFWGWKYNFMFMEGLTWPYFFKRFFGMTPRFILAWFILWFFAFVTIKKSLRTPREMPAHHHLIILWLAGSTLAVCIGGKFFGHYFIQLLPPLSILAAASISAWWQESRSLKFASWQRAIVITGIIVPPIVYLGTNWQEEQKRMKGENQHFQKIAAEIRKLTSDKDEIFIWGRMPELYYFSHRLPGSRFITSNFVVGMTTYNYHDNQVAIDASGSATIRETLLTDLTVNPPELIIDTAPQNFRQYGKYPISAFPRLHDFLHTNYRLAKTLDRLQIYSITLKKLSQPRRFFEPRRR